jgi:uncharacterized protein with NRDE domain
MPGSIWTVTADVCLVVLAFRQNSEYPLIVLGNRDEFHSRPARNAAWWSDKPAILGGRDLQAGGTWLALHRNGRFATVTNFRDAKMERPGLLSRGHLVTDFLQSELAPIEYLDQIDRDAYAGFNLLVADQRHLAYLSNRGGGMRELDAGIYGLSNATLDAPWNKVTRSKAALAALVERKTLNETHLLEVLSDRKKGPADEVNADHLSFSKAHALTAPFITLPDYGTRCSTVVMQTSTGKTRFLERRFGVSGAISGESRYAYQTASD